MARFINPFTDIGNEFRTDVALMDMKSKEPFSGDMRMIFLQLPYFEKDADACENNFERWIYVLKHMEALNKLPWVAKNPIFRRLAEIGEVSALSKEERIQYDAYIRIFRDNLYAMEGAEEVGMRKGLKAGIEQGLVRGRAEGRAEGILATARNFKALGISNEDIQKATGLSMEDIENL